MKEITTNNRTLLFVEVPEDATDMECRTAVLAQCFDREYNYIATTDTITEEQAAELVGSPITDFAYEYKSSIEQLQELLQHHSITGRHAIIEKL